MIMFMVFAVIAVVAGFGMVTSGGNPSSLQAAKDKFKNAFIGLIIVLAAFLLVDTVMRTLLKGGAGEVSGYGPWSKVQCHFQFVPEVIPQDESTEQVPTPKDTNCSDESALIAQYGGSPVGKVDPELTKLISCYRSDPAIEAALDKGQIYTVERSAARSICAATNGNPVCSPCSHSARSCHYGRGSGRGAMGVDFNAVGSEGALYDLIKARNSVCGGRLNFEGNHTHVSLNSC